MKKLIYLFLTVLIVGCSDDAEDKLCLVCTNMDFILSSSACGPINCAFKEGEETCEGDMEASCCFPGSIPSTISRPLTQSDIYDIKRFWENNGAICTLSR